METLSQDQVLDIITQDKFEAAVQFLKVYPELRHWLKNIDFMTSLADKYQMVRPKTYIQQLEDFNKLSENRKFIELVKSEQIDTLRWFVVNQPQSVIIKQILLFSSREIILGLLDDMIKHLPIRIILDYVNTKEDVDLLNLVLDKAEEYGVEVSQNDLFSILVNALGGLSRDSKPNLKYIEELLKRGAPIHGNEDGEILRIVVHPEFYDIDIIKLILKYRVDQLDKEDKKILRTEPEDYEYFNEKEKDEHEAYTEVLDEFGI